MICNFTYFSYPRVSSSRITNLHWPLGVGTYFCSVSKICKISNMANFLPYNFTNHSVFGRQKQRDFPPNLQSWRWKSTVLNVNSSIHFSYFLFSAKLCHMSWPKLSGSWFTTVTVRYLGTLPYFLISCSLNIYLINPGPTSSRIDCHQYP